MRASKSGSNGTSSNMHENARNDPPRSGLDDTAWRPGFHGPSSGTHISVHDNRKVNLPSQTIASNLEDALGLHGRVKSQELLPGRLELMTCTVVMHSQGQSADKQSDASQSIGFMVWIMPARTSPRVADGLHGMKDTNYEMNSCFTTGC